MRKTALLYASLFSGLLCVFNAAKAQTQNVQVTITGIKSDKGQILLNVYKDQETFSKDKPFKKIMVAKKLLSNGSTIVEVPLEPGTYGITLLDDEDSNGDMNKNMVGMPKEGFGFSNFFLEKMKRPAFDDFKIQVAAGQQNKAEIRTKYM